VLAHSDFIFAAIVPSKRDGAGNISIRSARTSHPAVAAARQQVFERLLVIGICIHFFVQVFIMVGGTLNLLPMTGVTIPFLSLGGMALLVNLTEIGLVLSISQRHERQLT
jgi:cell division protein FtsW (lipid II flippase)